MELIKMTRALKRYQLVDFLKTERKWWENKGVKLYFSRIYLYYAWRTITDYDRSRELHGIDDRKQYEAFSGDAIEEYNPNKHKELKELYRQIKGERNENISALNANKQEKSGNLEARKSVYIAN